MWRLVMRGAMGWWRVCNSYEKNTFLKGIKKGQALTYPPFYLTLTTHA